MNDKEKELLNQKIKKAIQLSSQKLVASKRVLGQSVVVSKNSKIQHSPTSITRSWQKVQLALLRLKRHRAQIKQRHIIKT